MDNPDKASNEYFTPVIGWRSWLISAHGRYLLSVTNTLGNDNNRPQWGYRMPFQAHCLKGKIQNPNHTINPECPCGIYAATSFFEAYKYLDFHYEHTTEQSKGLIGTVKLWGDVVQYENGYKGSIAYPQELWYIPRDYYAPSGWEVDLDLLSEAYGVPIHQVKSWKDCPHDRFYGETQIPYLERSEN